MTVYVDPLFEHGGGPDFRWTRSCYMWADTLEELHQAASVIGMKRAWFQNRPGFPHYDLVPRRRAAAVRAGAVEVTRRALGEALLRGRDAQKLV